MTPARTNQNWLPGIFNEILGDNSLGNNRVVLKTEQNKKTNKKGKKKTKQKHKKHAYKDKTHKKTQDWDP